MPIRFRDRRHAGKELAAALSDLRGTDALVLALPRGGIPVAAEVARALDLPLDIVLVRKVGLPGQPELALAAVAGPSGDTLVLNPEVAHMARLDEAEIARLAEPQRAALRRRFNLWIKGRAVADPSGRTVILVDDGIATGATMRAAIEAVRAQGARRVIVAVPVAPADTVAAMRSSADAVHCLHVPTDFWAVGAHYEIFDQVPDDDVRRILDECAQEHRPKAPPQT